MDERPSRRRAEEEGRAEAARAVRAMLDSTLARPEHVWYGR